ncbi:hypothetical protein P255_00463 [Acinetobacter brisouii CIP 110357]|uniref:Uncharacterized protein n=1 Tax=Acinetobacter brisouii CIP 110357 TaxID=1341683 RepID=V2UQS8_9GAMM|nr:hypothetical protein [Acinetobacter brisouii]ENV46324.1 hypothetical protein F954_02303 [Acinetobacter brisouii ANC 4119]ESK52312.1 hypothetical protein P255_00463 [Acinetobacter brisouii CIP 110357]
MATLKELHNKRGNPDLGHWNTIKLFSIAEASLLTAGLEPCEYNHLADYELRQKLLNEKPINWQHALMLIRSLIEAICTQEIKSPLIRVERSDYNDNCWNETVEQAKISLDDTSSIVANETKIHRDELHKWLRKNGYFEIQQQNIINVQQTVYQQPELIDHNNIILLPEPTYTTPALEAIQGVVNEFWISYDPDSNQPPPKQSTVKSWIAEHYPEMDSDYIQTAIDKICRHPKAKNGGNTKRNQ